MNFNVILKSCILSGCDEASNVDTKAAILKNLPEYFFFKNLGTTMTVTFKIQIKKQKNILISLQHGRFTFRHDGVLQHLVLVLKSFLKGLPNNTTTKCNTINFVRSGAKFSKTNIFSEGILHLASDWIHLAKLKSDYVFPFQLAYTELHPDFALFPKSSKQAVLLEFTCPCKENMESWHSQRLNKYNPLAKVIEDNSWSFELFAVEVGSQGYSSSSLSICLKKLGFNNKIVQKATKF